MNKVVKKNKGGRPSKYSPDVLKVVEEYLAEAVPENMAIPTVEGLSLKLDVNKTTLYKWKKESPKFSNALSRLKRMQKETLVKIGIFGGKEINSNIVSLLLKVNHNMIEAEKRILEGSEDKPIKIKVVPELDLPEKIEKVKIEDDGDRLTNKKLPGSTEHIQQPG